MTNSQEQHLKNIIRIAGEMIDEKYRAGQKKHGGNLFDLTPLQLAEESIMEAIDQMTYLITLRDKLQNGTYKPNNLELGRQETSTILEVDGSAGRDGQEPELQKTQVQSDGPSTRKTIFKAED